MLLAGAIGLLLRSWGGQKPGLGTDWIHGIEKHDCSDIAAGGKNTRIMTSNGTRSTGRKSLRKSRLIGGQNTALK